LINIALLLGGDSSEREISWKTALSMHGALSPEKYCIAVWDVTSRVLAREEIGVDESRLAPDEIAALQTWWRELGENARRTNWRDLSTALIENQIEVSLPALHGGWGEDGTLQTLLKVAGIRYVGSPPRASVVAMDKNLGKAVARDLGIAVARGEVLTDPKSTPDFRGKVVVKPNDGGSSVGVAIVDSRDENAFRAALENTLKSGAALVEEFVSGVEVTAAIVGSGENARGLPLVEIVPQSAWYDFQSKYAAGGSQHLIPPRLSEEIQARIADQAMKFYRALDCRGVARSDWIVTPEGVPYFLEINTLPGMTRTSLVPDAARAGGISFESLLEQLSEDALA